MHSEAEATKAESLKLQKRQMRVCMVSPSFPRWQGDFSGLMVWNLIRWLEANGCTVKVVTQHYAGCAVKERIGSVEIRRFRFMWPAKLERIGTVSGVIDDLRASWLAKLTLPLFLLAFTWKVWRVSRGCNMLHIQWVPTIAVALPAKYLRGIPLVVNCRTNPDTPLWRFLYRVLLPRADHVVFNSSATRDSTAQVIRHPHTTVIGSGINIDQFRSPAGGPPKRNSTVFRLVVVARLVEYKGIEYLIRALHQIASEVHFHLDIFSDGPLRKTLEALSSELGLANAITFHGETPREKILQYMWAADLFVLPSILDRYGRTEGFGAVLLEAMAAGLPVVASRVGGIVDIVNGTNGILVEPKDVEGLATAIRELAKNPDKRAMLAASGHHWVIQKFSDESMALAYREVYQTVLGIQRRGAALSAPF